MATCQDLINKIEQLRVIYVAAEERNELFQTDVIENLLTLAQITEQLNQRLVHRDFAVQAALDQAQATGLAGDVIAARIGQLIQAITGVLPPGNVVPDTPITDTALNLDTPYVPPEEP